MIEVSVHAMHGLCFLKTYFYYSIFHYLMLYHAVNFFCINQLKIIFFNVTIF